VSETYRLYFRAGTTPLTVTLYAGLPLANSRFISSISRLWRKVATRALSKAWRATRSSRSEVRSSDALRICLPYSWLSLLLFPREIPFSPAPNWRPGNGWKDSSSSPLPAPPVLPTVSLKTEFSIPCLAGVRRVYRANIVKNADESHSIRSRSAIDGIDNY
jgi:hypothetical protein